MQAASARRCFQPAGEIAGQLLLAFHEAEALERLRHRRAGVRQFVDPGDEIQILADRQILPETELLRHVTDVVLDPFGLGAKVVAEHRALAFRGAEQAAQHADGGGLARAVGAEEAPDLPRRHRDIDVVDRELGAEALGQPTHVDGEFGGHERHRDGAGDSGCPPSRA
ncbi:MAG: hypothetical protein WDM81_21760 [Rhizomicrobium sp.]